MTKVVTGHRPLSETQIARMNEIKTAGRELGALLEKIILDDGSAVMKDGAVCSPHESIDSHCMAIAKTKIQTGIMWAVRAIAKPEGFC
jgi:hypothetical protein